MEEQEQRQRLKELVEEGKRLKEEEILLGSGSRRVGLALNGFATFG